MENVFSIISEFKWILLLFYFGTLILILLRKRIQNVRSFKYGDKHIEFEKGSKYFENDYFKLSIENKTVDQFSEDILVELRELAQNLSSKNVYENRFKKNLILWRLKVLNTKVSNIKSETWKIGAQSTFSYIRYIYGSMIELLSDEDEYYSISSMRFWSKDKVFNSELYLTQNLEACKRGVIINRKILIDKNKLDSREVRELIEKHERCLERVNVETRNRFNLLFILTNNYENSLEKYKGFGLALHRKENEKRDCIALITSNTISHDAEPEVNVFITREGNSNYTKIILHLLNNYETVNNKNEVLTFDKLKKRIQ